MFTSLPQAKQGLRVITAVSGSQGDREASRVCSALCTCPRPTVGGGSAARFCSLTDSLSVRSLWLRGAGAVPGPVSEGAPAGWVRASILAPAGCLLS